MRSNLMSVWAAYYNELGRLLTSRSVSGKKLTEGSIFSLLEENNDSEHPTPWCQQGLVIGFSRFSSLVLCSSVYRLTQFSSKCMTLFPPLFLSEPKGFAAQLQLLNTTYRIRKQNYWILLAEVQMGASPGPTSLHSFPDWSELVIKFKLKQRSRKEWQCTFSELISSLRQLVYQHCLCWMWIQVGCLFWGSVGFQEPHNNLAFHKYSLFQITFSRMCK